MTVIVKESVSSDAHLSPKRIEHIKKPRHMTILASDRHIYVSLLNRIERYPNLQIIGSPMAIHM